MVYQFLKDGAAPFPFAGDMGSEEYSFTIDFERDMEIVPNRSIKNDMAAYNRQANAEKGPPAAWKNALPTCRATSGQRRS